MRKSLFILTSVVAILAVIYSCRDEIFSFDSEPPPAGTQEIIEAARNFFNARVHTVSLPKTGKNPHEHEKKDKDSLSLEKNEYLRSDSMHSTQTRSEGSPHQHHANCCNHHSHATRSSTGESSLPELKESNIVLMWEKARTWSDSLSSYVEVPMNIGNNVLALKRLHEKGKEMQFETSRIESMLVMERPKGSYNYLGYVVTLVGEKEYLKKAGSRVKTFRHKPRDTDFTGTAFYSHLNGRIMRAFYYTDGKPTHKLIKVEENNLQTERSMVIRFFDMSVNGAVYTRSWEFLCNICGTTHALDDDEVCDFAEIVNCLNCGRSKDYCRCCWYCGNYPCSCYKSSVCCWCWNDPCTCFTTCTNCWSSPCTCSLCAYCGRNPCSCPGGGSGSSGTGGGGSIGGGGSAGPIAKTIFQNPDMAKENWEMLERRLEKIIKHCMGNALLGSLEGKDIYFKMGRSTTSSYNKETNTLTLGTQLESDQLFHEMIHVYQYENETLASFAKSAMNQEIEAHYAHYLYAKTLSEYSGSDLDEAFRLNPRLGSARNLETYIDSKGNLLPTASSELLDVYIEYTVVPRFRESAGYENFKYDEKRTGLSNFSNIRKLTQNCE